MAVDQLQIYNLALHLCGERALASLTENREPRRLLDQVWSYGKGGVHACLEEGQWAHAIRAARLDFDPSFDPDFGYRRVFPKPSDWVATSAVCTDEFFNVPLLQYADESQFWYADEDELFVKYVSDNASFGKNYAAWPESFTGFVAAHFASKIVFKLTGSKEEAAAVLKLRERALKDAKNASAMTQPTKFPPPGSWVHARSGRSRNRRDGGGNTGPLIG